MMFDDAELTAGESSDAFGAYYGLGRRRGHIIGLTKRFISPRLPKPESEPSPFFEIRRTLVGIRYTHKPTRLKRAAERWITTIDDGGTPAAFKRAHANFLRKANEASFPTSLPVSTIASVLGLSAEEAT